MLHIDPDFDYPRELVANCVFDRVKVKVINYDYLVKGLKVKFEGHRKKPLHPDTLES